MSHHEWNDVMYGIELPSTYPSNDKILEFIDNHKEVFKWFTDENYYPAIDNIDEFLDDYENYMGNTGIAVLIEDVIESMFIESAYDYYGNEFIGMYASTMFPWQMKNMSEGWQSITPEYIDYKIRPVIEELYGMCPEFKEHVIWQQG